MDLIINNSWTYVKNCSSEDMDTIYTALSFDIPGAFYSWYTRKKLWDGKKHFFQRPWNRFPTGLLDLVLQVLDKVGTTSEIKCLDRRVWIVPKIKPVDIKEDLLAGITLRDYQIDAIRACLEKKRGIVDAAVNAGKTLVIAGLFKAFGKRSLYLTHRRDLFHQTYDFFVKHLDADIGQIVGDTFDPQEFTVAMVQSIWSKIKIKPMIDYLRSVDVLVLEEVQLSSAYTWNTITMKTNAGVRIGVSGTPFVEDVVRDVTLLGATGGTIFNLSGDVLVDRGFSARPVVFYKTSENVDIEDFQYPDAYKFGVVINKSRNNFVVRTVEECLKRKFPVMILVQRVAHGKILKEELEEVGINAEFLYGAVDPLVRRSCLKKFGTENYVLIASTVFDLGIDTPYIKVLVIAGGGKAWWTYVQRIGRGQRKKTIGKNVVYVLDFYDEGNQYIAEHSKSRYNTSNKRKFDNYMVSSVGEILSYMDEYEGVKSEKT